MVGGDPGAVLPRCPRGLVGQLLHLRSDYGKPLECGRLPDVLEEPEWFTCSNKTQVGSDVYLHNEVSRACAQAEPSEALILWHEAPGDAGSMTSCAVLCESGIVLHEIEEATEYFYAKGDAPGLWGAENVRFWSHRDTEGGYDCGIEYDLHPAGAENVERFGFTLSELDEENMSATNGDALEEGEPGQGIANRYLQRAAAAENVILSPVPIG
jgi:hypothetical protein